MRRCERWARGWGTDSPELCGTRGAGGSDGRGCAAVDGVGFERAEVGLRGRFSGSRGTLVGTDGGCVCAEMDQSKARGVALRTTGRGKSWETGTDATK